MVAPLVINKCVESYNPVSIIIPCLNEEQTIRDCILALHPLRERGCEVIVVDGGSADKTVQMATPLADHILHSEPGRAKQMNLGASYASGEWLLFLHTDTRLPAVINDWVDQLYQASFHWGFFALRLSGRRWPFRIIERAISFRSRITGIATGDQCQFVRRLLFEELGGFADIALMEDIELSRRLGRVARPLFWRQPVITSSRRWERRGIVKTVLLMWRLRLAYFLGASPRTLHDSYHD